MNLLWAALGCPGLLWAALGAAGGCFGLPWAAHGCPGLPWAGWLAGRWIFRIFKLNLELGQMFSGQNCFGGRKQSAVIVSET